MSEPVYLGLVFLALWLATWYPCWWLMLKLLAIIAADKKLDTRFWLLFVLYRLLIALPYIALLWLGQGVLNEVIETIIVGFVVVGILFSILRFMAGSKIISALWYVYGYVYDGLLHFYPYRKLTDDVVELAQSELRAEPRTILEIGCGTGNVITKLEDVYPHAEITGIDISRSMLKIARRKTNAVFHRIDAHGFLTATSEQYDLIIMQNSLYAINDRDRLWPELFSKLTPQGVIVITNSDLPGSGTIIREHLAHASWIHLLNPRLILVGLIDAFISQLSGEGAFNFVPEQTLRHEISSFGGTMGKVKRVYGGVNILFSIKKDSVT